MVALGSIVRENFLIAMKRSKREALPGAQMGRLREGLEKLKASVRFKVEQ